MSVCVKGMYLPPNCYFCPMTNDGFYLCKANNPYKQLEDDCEERRPNWCPLIEVPEPHGRLIDADAVIDLVMQYCPDDDGLCSKAGADLRELLDEIENLPTIIPAET